MQEKLRLEQIEKALAPLREAQKKAMKDLGKWIRRCYDASFLKALYEANPEYIETIRDFCNKLLEER